MRENLSIYRYLILAVVWVLSCDTCGAQQLGSPQITAIEPNSAVTTPGAKIMVIGAHLSPESIVYFGGLQARETAFINSSTLECVSPYVRPGRYKMDLKSGETIIHSNVDFTALPAAIDSDIDRAEGLAAKKQLNDAIGILTSIAATHVDYDVRAYAHYSAGQLYLAQGDYWAAAEQAALIWDAKVSHGVHSSWQYRMLYDQTAYSVSESDDQDTDLRIADGSIKWDVTENPELRFWRALVSARFAKMKEAKIDLKFVLAAKPEDPSYRALAAYIGVLAADKTQLAVFRGKQLNDARALALLGQAAYISGDYEGAREWWTAQGKASVASAKLDCWAGRKHLKYGQVQVGTALIAECATVAPDSPEGKEAKYQLANLRSPR